MVRKYLAWLLYYAGALVWKIDSKLTLYGCVYPLYNRLMTWSSSVQGPSDNGPWSASLKGTD